MSRRDASNTDRSVAPDRWRRPRSRRSESSQAFGAGRGSTDPTTGYGAWAYDTKAPPVWARPGGDTDPPGPATPAPVRGDDTAWPAVDPGADSAGQAARGRDDQRRTTGGGRRSRTPQGDAKRHRETDQLASDDGEYERARTIALNQLSHAPRSRHQLEEKMAARDIAPHVATAVLDRLSEVGLVDDAAYAAALVRSQQQGRGLARRALAQELRRKGVDADVAEQALEQVESADEEDRARALVEKKLTTMHGLTAQVQTRRLAGMLARKGYPSETAFRIIREALADAPEHARD